MSKWIDLPTKAGAAESKARLETVPEIGPFVFVSQFHADRFEREYYNWKIEDSDVSKKFDLRLGCVTFAVTFDGPKRVGYWYDTSD